MFSLSINGRALSIVGIRNKIALCKQVFERAPLLLKCLKRTLYVWDGFITISLNHLFMLMIRFYDDMIMLTNNTINILNDLMWVLSHCCIDMLEHIYFICLTTYSSWILTGYGAFCSTHHCWRTSTSFYYIVGVQMSFHVCTNT